ncbi:MAG: alpha-L-fucosidase [Chitinophagaceae bacterium]|nr:alpha-L-fucosidase [Chitinophagaceae bacterium]
MKKYMLTFLLFTAGVAYSQPFQDNWESLDKRVTPQWWKDAKFGIFIHWGTYSVPGWSTKGNYAEWYQQGLQTTDTARQRFHREKFGSKTYYDLAPDFKAELFKPDEWAKLFEASGAKYIVLTSKHHDGYALWPSAEASKTWGFPWNASVIGPKRDLLGDLFKAVRKTSVRAGMYYSLYEWFNPLWLSNKPAYVDQHMWPQMKDLITNYQPDIFWTDGEWDAPAETWKSQQFLAWLFNESPVKDKIVVNDRWGSGVRFKHGGFFTPEYQPDLDFENHDWEESRGMGHSYGYNREEDAWDYNSTQSLVVALIDKVSRGGNFLLDIGPDEHGKIPPIMQERLLEVGDWLKLNGEAIYGTTRWIQPMQWSEGKRDYKMKANDHAGNWRATSDIMLKLTVDPDPGYAVKEVFFTYQPGTNSVYAITPKYPENNELILKDIQLPVGTTVTFLSNNQKLNWTQSGSNVIVNMPSFTEKIASIPYAYGVKIENFGRFNAKPMIKVSSNPKSPLSSIVSMTIPASTVVRYTTDGSTPTSQSPVYSNEFVPEKTLTVKAKAFSQDRLPSALVTQEVNVLQWREAHRVRNLLPGLFYQAFEVNATSMSDLVNLASVKQGTASAINISPLTRKENAALQFDGFLKITKDGIYTFYLSSDDGSILTIDDQVIIDHDGLHGNDEKQGVVALKKGYHKIQVDFFQATGGIDLKLLYSAAGLLKTVIPATALFHLP